MRTLNHKDSMGWRFAFARIRRDGKLIIGNHPVLSTSQSIDEEIFSLLRGYSEVPERGKRLLAQNHNLDAQSIDSLYLEFQAYIRQAKDFYSASLLLHTRTRPLTAYYAFLNLAKAALCRLKPELMLEIANGKRVLRHGLKLDSPAPFADEKVKIESNGVFTELYESYHSIGLPPKHEFPIASMFPYISDVSFESSQLASRAPCVLTGKLRLIQLPANQQTCMVLALSGLTDSDPAQTPFNRFFSQLEEVKISDLVGGDWFSLARHEIPAYRFFITSEDANPNNHLTSVRRDYCSIWPFATGPELTVNAPLGETGQYPWNEFFAAYVLFFYLGSRVRYRPRTIEQLLPSSDGWIVDQFSRSSLTTCLRHFLEVVTGEPVILNPR